MIEFAWPYLFLLVPLPYLIHRFLQPCQLNERAALKVPELDDFKNFKQSKRLATSVLNLLLASLIWLAILTAAARPQWIGESVQIPQNGRDLMLAVDLSGSMQIQDFEVNGKYTDRLTALKVIASDFIDRRKGDRLGLILFGSQAYLQVPLTFDSATVKQLLMESEVGLAGQETAIGDAVGLAVKQLQETKQTSRVLILLTDGNNNTGELTPERAAEIASRSKLKVHTVAIGAKSMVVQTLFGRQRVNPSVEIDEKALKLIAESTGGKYFRAYNTEELAKIYREIDQLETVEQNAKHYRPADEVYYWPLLLALLFFGILICYKSFR